jgi:glycosyltransferase involved in cell wall biosynthesis
VSAPGTPAISVAICTYNRATSLAETLASVAALLDPGVPWELLVVDNNSSDDTPRVLERFAAGHAVRMLAEPRQGLSHARNRATAECRGDVLAFTDDDVRLDPGWLSALAAACRRFPDAGYFGGRIRPLWLTPRPRGFLDDSMAHIGGLLMWYDLGEDVRPYVGGELLPYGANMALRRRLLERVGAFRADLGPIGAVPGRGDDDEYLGRAREAGFGGVYVGDALCRHVVDPARLTVRYLYRFGVQKGIALARMGRAGGRRGSVAAQALHLLRAVGQAAKGRGDRWRQCVVNAGIEGGLRRGGP